MRGTIAVATRIWLSLRGDPRTVALVFVAPVFLIFLFDVVLENVPGQRFDATFVKPLLLGFFVYLLTYVLTSVGFLRERQSGTLERLLASPINRYGLVGGYVVGLGALAIAQAFVILGAGVWILDVDFAHGVWAFLLIEILAALSALGLGILISNAAHNEFQVMQLMPVVIAPQLILGGAFVPVDALPLWAEWAANIMPLTYIISAMDWVVLDRGSAGDLWAGVGVLSLWSIATMIVAALMLRRR